MRRADAARNAGLLLAVSRELFAERGPEVPLDEVDRRAGVGNATLHRHVPTRGDLLVAVYADEVAALVRRGEELGRERAPAEALFAWLEAFVVHVATKRDLALAITDDGVGGVGGARRSELFDRRHALMRTMAEALLARAREAGAVRADLAVADLLALTSATAIAAGGADRARRLLRLLREGLAAD
ncbi:TetR/AcrR family transcriptional regulator [Streptomyces sp. 6N223]|uniref:TetR/AcrR family transcriptional regulator n=1 Tax=Streptomyces sp. 6N223 TaxID=3457412 RepID=UPI003FCF9D53